MPKVGTICPCEYPGCNKIFEVVHNRQRYCAACSEKAKRDWVVRQNEKDRKKRLEIRKSLGIAGTKGPFPKGTSVPTKRKKAYESDCKQPDISITDCVAIIELVKKKHGITMSYGKLQQYTDDEKRKLMKGKKPWK